MISDEFKNQEELRRDRRMDPRDRWRLLQDMIGWADAQITSQRNTRQSRLAEQNEKLAWLRRRIAKSH